MSVGVDLGPAVGTNISSLSSLSPIFGSFEDVVYVLSVGFAFGEMLGWRHRLGLLKHPKDISSLCLHDVYCSSLKAD